MLRLFSTTNGPAPNTERDEMPAFEQSADRIAKLGATYGARQLIALEAAGEAAGLGFRWSDTTKTFEFIMDTMTDVLTERSYSPEAVTLFCAEARLQFYGILASNQQRITWTTERDEAWADVANAREAA